MSVWNRNALLTLQDKLKLMVSMHSGLSDILEKTTGGFMSQSEALVVREKPSSHLQMGMLIAILCGKCDKDFSTFIQMLRRTNYGVWAEVLEKKAEELKRHKGVCAEREEATQRCSDQCVCCTVEDLVHTWHSTVNVMYFQVVALVHISITVFTWTYTKWVQPGSTNSGSTWAERVYFT